MDLLTVMKDFSALNGATVGIGPDLQSVPDVSLKLQIEAFIEQYPFLKKDKDYIAFLKTFSGSNILREDNSLIVDIYGFLDVSTHIEEYEDPVIDDDGFFAFATIIINNTQTLGFAFDSTGDREYGVYRVIFGDKPDAPYYWYCRTFLEWLERLVRHDGRLLETNNEH